MIQNIGSIEYDARINTKQLKSDAAEVQKVTQGAANSMGATLDETDAKSTHVLGNVMGKVKAASLAAVAAVSAASVATAAFGVKSAADFQQTRIGLENMLGSADKARSLLTDISKFAAETPFEFPELAQATRQLVAFGFSGEAAFDTMKQLGDVSAAVGTPINDLAYLMGTLKTQGRAFTIDIRQFAQRGIPIYEYLAKVLGTNEKAISEMIEAGKIGFPEVQKAFQAMTGEGGKFNNAMKAQSKSLTGIFSTLKDNIGQTVREMVGITVAGDVKPGSLMDWLLKGGGAAIEGLPKVMETIKNVLKGIGDVLGQALEYLGPKFRELWASVRDELIPIFKDLWHNVIEPLAPIIGTVLVAAIGLAIDAVKIVIEALGWLHEKITEGNPIIWGLIGVFGALATAMAFNAVFNALNVGFAVLRLVTIPATMVSVGALQALIMAPIVMPAIAVGAALASIALVIDAARKMHAEIDKAQAAAVNSGNAIGEFNASLRRARDEGRISQEEFLRRSRAYNQGMQVNGYASGTSFAPGGVALVGENGPELVNLPRGSEVIPNHHMDSEMGGSRIENHIGTIYISKEADAEHWLKRLTQDQEIIGKGLTPQTRYA